MSYFRVFAVLMLLGASFCAAQNVGRSTGPFVKINDLWLVYTNPVMTLDQGRLMVPARYFAHVAAMGFFTRGTQAVVLRFEGRNLEFEINSNKVALDGQIVASSRLSYVREGRVMIPLETVARAFGLGMQWDAQRKLVLLSRPGLASEEPFPGDALGPYARDPLFLSARMHLVDRYIGIYPSLPEVPNITPARFQWAWRHIRNKEYAYKRFLHLSMDHGFQVRLVHADKIPQRTYVVFGIGVDHERYLFGYAVAGVGQYVAYMGQKDPNDREYCYQLIVGQLDCHVEARMYWGEEFRVPRFVFLRIYTR